MKHEDYDNHMRLQPAWLTGCPVHDLAAFRLRSPQADSFSSSSFESWAVLLDYTIASLSFKRHTEVGSALTGLLSPALSVRCDNTLAMHGTDAVRPHPTACSGVRYWPPQRLTRRLSPLHVRGCLDLLLNAER